ncbi:MAG TPA: choice-of-anchor tandem repeat GloVer-containing protein [Candidatus Cybelea sp.]|nr:choice-of-anchor tandem repeat GloVer-containing protein [Candidatus Cybelea sp.]
MIDVRKLLTVSVVCASVAACSPVGAPGVLPAHPMVMVASRNTGGHGYDSIFSFDNTNGASPDGVLLYYQGKLYGTTETGGASSQGTVFSVTPSGNEKVLYSFENGGDGNKPEAGLTLLNGTFYGTTFAGGAHGYGTVYSVTPKGREQVLYSFGEGYSGDGQNPTASVTALNGRLYGTTSAGGDENAGTVFSVTTGGHETVVHKFPYYSKTDGEVPFGGLTALRGNLYGTTDGGGECREGVVFSVTPAGSEKVLHNFNCSTGDGSNPQANMVWFHGRFYGTTSAGGANFYDDGIIFSMGTAGNEQVVYTFHTQARPTASLIGLKGAVCGVTSIGGTSGDGTIFSLKGSNLSVLHNFGTPPDGVKPLAGLTDVHGTLYGTTSEGGGYADDGMVYKISP